MPLMDGTRRYTYKMLQTSRHPNRLCITLSLLLLSMLSVPKCSDGTNLTIAQIEKIKQLAKSAEMRAYMDTTMNPCEDFYTYACGNWLRVNPANNEMKTSIFNVVLKGYQRKVGQLLKLPKLTSETDMDRKVKYFHESCLNSRSKVHGVNYRQQLLSVVEEFGGMPAVKGAQWQERKFNWLHVAAQILRKYGKAPLLGTYVLPDIMNNEFNRLYLGHSFDLQNKLLKSSQNSRQFQYEYKLMAVLGLSAEVARKTAAEFVHFERDLAVGLSDPHSGLGWEDLTRLRMLEDMTEMYKPVLNFTAYISTWLGYDYILPVYEYGESYLANLRLVLLITRPAVVANYMMWDLVHDLYVDKYDNTVELQRSCVDLTVKYFYKYVDNMVYRQLKDHYQQHIKDIQALWLELKRAFEKMLDENHTAWLTELTRDKALEKLSAMTLEIASYDDENFSKEFGELIVSNNNVFENLLNVLQINGRNFRQLLDEPPRIELDAHQRLTPCYVGALNKVIIPVMFLQPRYLWDSLYPTALRYATVGYMIAHEMAHAFDDTTREYDAKGNFNNWWDRQSTQGYLERKECFKQQLSEFNYNNKPMPYMNAQGENIADNVGARIAYAAYEQWLALNVANNSTETLPNMRYTPQQLFFIGMSQLWCADVHWLMRDILTMGDAHPPEAVRVRSMLSNFEQFAVDFQCQPGSKMNPHRKCVLFKL